MTKRSPLNTVRREKRAEAGGLEPKTDGGHAIVRFECSHSVSPAVEANALPLHHRGSQSSAFRASAALFQLTLPCHDYHYISRMWE